MQIAELLQRAPKAPIRTSLRLKEVVLPAGYIPGMDVEWAGQTGNKAKHFLEGYDGIKFIGQGPGLTHIVPKWGTSDAWDSTIFIGPGARRVEFHGVTIHGGPRKAVHYGLEHLPDKGVAQEPLSIVFADYEIVADEPDAGPWVPKPGGLGNTSVWGVFGYDAELISFRGRIDWRRGAEHGYYAHGTAGHGLIYDSVDWVGCGAECAKLATRPGESFPPQGSLLVKNCTFRDWKQPWSWRGGGGVVVQGGGINAYILDSLFFGGPGADRSRCLMFDDGGQGRFYSANTKAPGENPANGWILVQNCLIVGDGLPWWGLVSRVGTLSPWAEIEVARGFAMVGCGVYSRTETVKLELGRITNGNVLIEGCNTPAILDLARTLDPSIQSDAQVSGSVGTFPIAQGYKGGIFRDLTPSPV